jgi:hypothetical protein
MHRFSSYRLCLALLPLECQQAILGLMRTLQPIYHLDHMSPQTLTMLQASQCHHTARPSTEDVMAAVEAGTSQYPLGEAFSIGSWMKDTPGWDTFINAHEVNVSAIDGTQLRYVFKAFTRRQKAVDGFMEKNMVCYMHVRGDVEKLSQRECCVIKKGWSIKSTKARKWRHQTRKTLLF